MDDEIDDDEENEGGGGAGGDPQQQPPGEQQDDGGKGGRKKKKKKKRHGHRDDWKKQIMSAQFKTEFDNGDLLIDGQQQHQQHQQQQQPMMASTHDVYIQHADMSLQPHQTDGGMEAAAAAGSILAAPTFAAPQPVTLDVNPPKISPSPLIQIPQQALDAAGTGQLKFSMWQSCFSLHCLHVRTKSFKVVKENISPGTGFANVQKRTTPISGLILLDQSALLASHCKISDNLRFFWQCTS